MANKMPGANLEFVREDDYVEYYIFPQLPDNLQSTSDVDEQTSVHLHLTAVQSQCESIATRLISERGYIWHKDEFHLQPRTGSAQERLLNDEGGATKEQEAAAPPLPPHLHGVSHYGDNIADEWFVVYLLSQLTRELPGCIVRVADSDGEFLMIEAADVLPKWANPETCEQRVYIADGEMQLVQNSPSNTAKLMPVSTAIAKIRQNPTLYRVSREIQACIDERLKEFVNATTSASAHLHRQIVHLPLGVAALLKERPTLIASAVRAFCERDSVDLKACRTMRYFPPEQRVRTNVRFTRCLYAMVMHSQYVPDRKIGWNLSGDTTSEPYKEDLLGVKIACGFEILASQAKDANGGGEENEPAWRAYVRSLAAKGYFRGQLEGSQEYKRLLEEARSYYKRNCERFRTAPLVGREILDLLRSVEVNAELLRDQENNLQSSDSDDWLNITADQLDEMLLARYGPKKLYKSNGDLNAEEFTKNIAEFLEKQSAFDGIDNDSDDDDEVDDDEDDDNDDETKETSTATSSSSRNKNLGKRAEDFKAKLKKNASMRRACKQNSVIDANKSSSDNRPNTTSTRSTDGDDDEGLSTHVRNFLDFVIPEDNWDSTSEMSDYEDEDDMERNFAAMASAEMNIDADIKEYMAQMDRELAKTTMGQSFVDGNSSSKNGASGQKASKATTEDDFDDIESFEPININVNTLKNMMDSYKSQIGGAGPASNLFSAMGVGMSAADGNSDAKKDLSESAV